MPRSGPRRITKYTREFKLAAVRLARRGMIGVALALLDQR
jgi:transposase-like protein